MEDDKTLTDLVFPPCQAGVVLLFFSALAAFFP